MQIEGSCLAVCEAAEFVAIVTSGNDGPHVVGHWGDYMFRGLGDGVIAFPVGRYNKTEENLRSDKRIQLLAASRKVPGTKSMGQGCLISGTAEIVGSGAVVDAVRVKFPWARGALVVHVEEVRTQL